MGYILAFIWNMARISLEMVLSDELLPFGRQKLVAYLTLGYLYIINIILRR